MNYYINQYGMKTSKKLDVIIDKAWNYIYRESMNNKYEYKVRTKKWIKLIDRFNIEAERIGGVDYYLGDCIA